ncbi:MAG: patatin-like phospholipase family protein, partial [Acidobacteria bacterium]|nr:patatin-like phospholipase family protein [Acidobacteriota bacterium]
AVLSGWTAPLVRLALPPTLGSVLVLMIMLVWIFSGAAYFFDRYRVPVLVVFALILIGAAQFPQSDHYYDSSRSLHRFPVSPSDALFRSRYPTDSAIVVAASGGGIQAAAWAARVLTGLAEATADIRVPGTDVAAFAPAVRVVSSVSGGSVAALYFVAAFNSGSLELSQMRRQIYEPAVASSLDEAAWGLVYPDMVRSFAPLLLSPRIDRGWAMERAWSRFGAQPERLADWRADVLRGGRPAVLFNATITETGERLLLSTLDLPSAAGRRNFYDVPHYGEYDVSPVTAARLSASFPYVTPVARISAPVPRDRRYHIADGGYYDNFGIVSLADVLIRGLPKGAPVRCVLLLQILGEDAAGDPKSKEAAVGSFRASRPSARSRRSASPVSTRATSPISSCSRRRSPPAAPGSRSRPFPTRFTMRRCHGILPDSRSITSKRLGATTRRAAINKWRPSGSSSKRRSRARNEQAEARVGRCPRASVRILEGRACPPARPRFLFRELGGHARGVGQWRGAEFVGLGAAARVGRPDHLRGGHAELDLGREPGDLHAIRKTVHEDGHAVRFHEREERLGGRRALLKLMLLAGP